MARFFLGAWICLAVVLSSSPAAAASELAWSWNLPRPQGNKLNGVAYGNGVWVAAGDDGSVVRSTNGMDWTALPPPNPDSFQSVRFINGKFFAVGGYGLDLGMLIRWKRATVATSTNGLEWSVISMDGDPIQDIAFAQGRFVAIGSSAQIIHSPNGRDWLPATLILKNAAGGDLKAVAGSPDRFVAAGNSGGILASEDGITWTNLARIPTSFTDLIYTNRLFVAVSSDGSVRVSSDGLSWTKSNSGIPAAPLDKIHYAQGSFLACRSGGPIYRSYADYKFLLSRDGANWSVPKTGWADAVYSIAYGNGLFVAVTDSVTQGRGLFCSTDGIHWNRQEALTDYLNSVAFGDGKFMAVGWNSTVIQSDPVIQLVPSGPRSLLVRGEKNGRYPLESSNDLLHWSAAGEASDAASFEWVPTTNTPRFFRLKPH